MVSEYHRLYLSSTQASCRRRRSNGGAHLARAPSENIIMRAPAPSLAFFGPTILHQPRWACSPSFSSFLCLVLPLLCNLFICASRVMDLGRTCGRLWRSGTPCATWPAALVGLLTGPREKNYAIVMLFGATGCVQTDSASSQIRRNRRQESPLVVLRRIRDFAAGAR